MMCCHRPHLEQEDLYQESLSGKRKAYAWNPINPDYDICSYEDEPKIVNIVVELFHLKFNMLFDYSREPHSGIAFVDMKSFYASCECPSGAQPLDDFPLRHESPGDNSAGLIL